MEIDRVRPQDGPPRNRALVRGWPAACHRHPRPSTPSAVIHEPWRQSPPISFQNPTVVTQKHGCGWTSPAFSSRRTAARRCARRGVRSARHPAPRTGKASPSRNTIRSSGSASLLMAAARSFSFSGWFPSIRVTEVEIRVVGAIRSPAGWRTPEMAVELGGERISSLGLDPLRIHPVDGGDVDHRRASLRQTKSCPRIAVAAE